MRTKLTTILVSVLSLGFILLLGHELRFWGPIPEPGVVYLQDYNCSSNLEQQKKIVQAYERVLHKIWLDVPYYIEDVLFETDEFVYLDSIAWNLPDILSPWEDDEECYTTIKTPHSVNPDTIPTKP